MSDEEKKEGAKDDLEPDATSGSQRSNDLSEELTAANDAERGESRLSAAEAGTESAVLETGANTDTSDPIDLERESRSGSTAESGVEHREADQETAEARAARAATKAATEGGAASPPAPADPEREAKLAAAAEAPAARAAAKAAAEGEAAGPPAPADPEREAKLAVAAEARAARAAAKAAAEGGTPSAASGSAEQPPAATSPRQPELDGLVALIRDAAGPDAIESATLNELNGDLPTIIVQSDHLTAAANALKSAPQTRFTYLRNVSGVDYETHLEVVYHLVSLTTGRDAAIKVKADREQPQIPSVTPIWATANWNEREIYDLLGIHFTGHPDLRRIMMPDDWEGHPLRKDYAPLDPEV